MKIVNFLKHQLITLILLVSRSQSGYSQTFEAKVDSCLNAKYELMSPGATFLTAMSGNVIYRKAFDQANL